MREGRVPPMPTGNATVVLRPWVPEAEQHHNFAMLTQPEDTAITASYVASAP